MPEKRKISRPVRMCSWILPLGIFLGLQLIILLIDSSPWILHFRDGTLFDRLLNSKFFTEWFTPYNTPECNVLTILFAIILLPETLINAIEDIKSRRQTN
ncbi:YfzA family protein [Oceanobacillus sp. Castelsardo]|uniref:YfzA family protein n=1 Tax=Oceanobacillus sp. Castelsardo TaxID=1851204 RepID=UPI0008398926|nr:YfzA family protein [Oceanobacillus sp. Castelsardo]